jgi:hypothetical protein
MAGIYVKYRTMNQDGLINPNQPAAPPAESIDPKKVITKKKNDIIERKDQRVYTEDGKELLD